MSSQQLTMCLWGLACAGAAPHKAFVLLWFLSSMQHMQQATTQVCVVVSGGAGGYPAATPGIRLCELGDNVKGSLLTGLEPSSMGEYRLPHANPDTQVCTASCHGQEYEHPPNCCTPAGASCCAGALYVAVCPHAAAADAQPLLVCCIC
jgi:hypothetical protein